MDKYKILKIKKNGGDTNIQLKAHIGMKISSRTMANSNDDAIVEIQKSLSVRKDKLAEILNSKTFQPLFIDANDTSPSSSIGTSSNICDENMQPQSNNNEGTPPHRNLSGTNVMDNLTPPSIGSHISAMNNVNLQNNHHVLARLQRDLDSPSAAMRLRAIRALKSPGNGPYNQFDVPYEEQDIITEEERQEYIPKTIQEVMKDVIVYVETRFGDENRTAGIKEAVAELGATVNDNFNKKTTHVIFSNGTQSTYNKAKQLNIPIVSILWIEACKKQLRLVDPAKYSIHNIKHYENPELFKKVKVKKFFQTENELKIKKKKVVPTLMKFKPIKIPKKAKDNITGMINEFQQRQVNKANGFDYLSDDFDVADSLNDSKATAGRSKEVNSKRTLVTSPMQSKETKAKKISEKTTSPKTASAKLPPIATKPESPAIFKTPSKRKTMLAQSVHVEQSPSSLVRVTRRTSMLALCSPSVDHTPIQKMHQVMPEEIVEITNSNENQTNNDSEAMDISPLKVVSSTRVISNRRTIFTSSAMDITELQPSTSATRKRTSIVPARFKDFEVNTTKYLGKNATDISKSEKSNRRRTVFASNGTPSSSSTTVSTLNNADDAVKSNRRRTLNTVKQTTLTKANASSVDGINEADNVTPNQNKTVFAPNEASSPLVIDNGKGQGIVNLRRTLFKSTVGTPSPLAFTPTDNETKTTTAKRRRTILPPNDSTPKSLVVSTLKKVAEANSANGRRRTLFPPSSYSTNNLQITPLPTAPDEISNRRRTCFATSQTTSNQLTPASKDKLINGLNVTPVTNGGERNMNTADLTSSRDCLTPQGHTLFEEYSKRLSFSSTNKRHTDRDISLFIIEQRLKNLNEIARLNRSVSESDVNIETIEKKINDRIARSSPQLLIIPENNGNAANVTEQDDVVVHPPPPKKRKLFNPTAYEEQVAMQCTESSDNNNKANDKVLTQKTTKIPSLAQSQHKKRLKQRRSTMDFKTEPPKPLQVYASIMKSNASPMNYLAYSNMNQDQVNVITKAIAELGKFKIEPNVTKKTTHLVTFDSKRTQKFLRAIIRGLWIVNFDWVTASLQAGNWLYEEPFENRSVSTAVSICRAEAQAFGSKYKIEIFGHIEPIYISTKCKCKCLKELYTMCGGRVTNNRQTAKYIVTDRYKENQRCLHSDWILDSITAATCKGLSSYLLKLVPV